MKKVKKAGCILVDIENKSIALVFRKKHKDYSFPKGHLEAGETLLECAIRETAEETKRDCTLLEKDPVYIDNYVSPKENDVEVYYYLTKDIGPSDNDSTDTHPVIWVPFDEVENTLTYPSLIKTWESVKDKVKSYLDK